MRKTSSLPNSDAESPDYPFGNIRDEDGQTLGTPVINATYSDFVQSLWHFFTKASILPNGLPENTTNGFQLFKSMELFFQPVGTIMIWSGTIDNIPKGWLVCDGSQLNKTDYPDLFTIIGNNYDFYGLNFVLPNLAGKFPLGYKTGNPYGKTGGEETHILTPDELPSHSHKIKRGNSFIGDDGSPYSSFSGRGVANSDTYFGSESAGENSPHNNMPPYVSLIFIIKAKYDA